MKRLLILLLVLCAALFMCSCKQENNTPHKIGYLSLYDIEENPLTSAIWEGITLSSQRNDILYEYSKVDEDLSSYDALKALYNNGCRIIVSSEYALSDTIKDAQKKYSDCTFICIGYALPSPADNTVNITFSEHESGFIAGIASAMKIQNGRTAAILGMDLPSSNRYIHGFTTGINYANQLLGTTVTLDSNDIMYIGSYNDPDLAEKLSVQLYSSGVKCIFTDGGKTSQGIFSAAKTLRAQFPDIWVIGTETDKYTDGLFLDNYSVTLTSIINLYDRVIDDILISFTDGSLKSLKMKNYGIENFAIGLPDSNPNLSTEIITKCNEIISLIQNKKLVIPNNISLLN